MKKLVGQFRLVKAVSIVATALCLAGQAAPLLAQDTLAEARLRKIEAEIRAMQRVVFPGGSGKVFTPQITAGSAPATGAGQPATSAVTDLLARMETLEGQVAKLTGQIEQNSHRITQLEARLAGTVAGAGPADPVAAPIGAAAAAAPAAAPQANLNAMTGGASVAKTAASGTAADRLKLVQAIEKPRTDDPGDDEYSYGFRLWDAKFYPEAQQQLKLFVGKYPKHARVSYGRNLLGRAYLDGGDPRQAAQWFVENVTKDPKGGRAPDSLVYLAQSMRRINDTKRACIALAQFTEDYPAEAAGRLKSEYDAALNGLKCS